MAQSNDDKHDSTQNVSVLLDCGGHSIRAMAADAHGRILVCAERAVATRTHGTEVEQDAEALIAGLTDALVELARRLRALRCTAGKAALAVQRGNVLCWRRPSGRALGPVLSWRDRRGEPDMHIDAEEAEAIRRRTGLRYTAYGGVTKMRWLLARRSLADTPPGTLALGPLGAFLLARLLEEHPLAVDDSLAQRTLLWSRQRLDWDPYLLSRFCIPPQTLPPVHASEHEYGTLAMLPGRPVLGLLCGDQNAVPYLTGTPDPHCLYINLGTGGFLLRPVPELIDAQAFQLSVLARTAGGQFALEASIHGVATALDWLAESTGQPFRHDAIDMLCGQASRPPLFLNSIDGLGSPWWQSGPPPAFIATDAECEAGFEAHLLAVLESIAFLVRVNADTMSQHCGPPRRIVVSGGLSRSRTLQRLLAAILGTDIECLGSAEGTALGLWCRLHGRALGRDAWFTVPWRPDPALEARYRAWLARMPANGALLRQPPGAG
ncbi:MAG TPA: FGGY family carbohydrate kinase [Xanthomonadaceae bacterium]|nr:FGGY family carbohydrate kinase [Xanthomonadaceae bacterium]